MRSWDLLTSICKERLHTQVSSTQLHRNSSARLLLSPSPPSLLSLSFWVLPSRPALPASLLLPFPSFILLPFPSLVPSLPLCTSFPPSCLPCLLGQAVAGQTGCTPHHPPTDWNYKGLIMALFRGFPKPRGSLGAWVEGVGLEGGLRHSGCAVGSGPMLPGFKPQPCLGRVTQPLWVSAPSCGESQQCHLSYWVARRGSRVHAAT